MLIICHANIHSLCQKWGKKHFTALCLIHLIVPLWSFKIKTDNKLNKNIKKSQLDHYNCKTTWWLCVQQAPKFVSVLLPWAGYHVFDSFTSRPQIHCRLQPANRITAFVLCASLDLFSYSYNSFRISVFTSFFYRATFESHLFLPWHTGSFIWHGCHLMTTNEVALSILVFACSTTFDSGKRTCQTQFCVQLA